MSEPTVYDVAKPSALPWIAGPGQKLPPAPPLWALWSGTGHLLALSDGGMLTAAGWVLVVDAEGRSL